MLAGGGVSTMKFACLLFATMLVTAAYGQDLPDAPSQTVQASTLRPRPPQKFEPLAGERTWKDTFAGTGAGWFWLEQAGVVAVNVFDIEVTHQGLAHGHRGCVEKGEDPRPSHGDLYLRDMPITMGIVAWDVIVRKLRLPFAGHVGPAIAFYKHGRGGTKWLTQCW
jgi:hypothetical protein